MILVSEVDQIPTLSVLTALRNCDVSHILEINCQVHGYSYLGMGRMKISQQVATYSDRSDTVLPQTLRETDYPDLRYKQLGYCAHVGCDSILWSVLRRFTI